MKYIILLMVFFISGCTTSSRMNVIDLDYYQIDCNRRDEQLSFLRRQMPTKNERFVNGMRMTSPVGVISSMADGTYYEERATFDRKQQAIARIKIYQIESQCPELPPQPQGCVQVNEQFPAGNSQGVQCYKNTTNKPIINKWEVVN